MAKLSGLPPAVGKTSTSGPGSFERVVLGQELLQRGGDAHLPDAGVGLRLHDAELPRGRVHVAPAQIEGLADPQAAAGELDAEAPEGDTGRRRPLRPPASGSPPGAGWSW
jgi:hypothetical protein